MGLVLHCGGKEVTRAMVEAVPTPEPTDTWHPVPYQATLEFVEQTIDQQLHRPIRSETYGLNKAGDQMFGLMVVDMGSKEMDLSIGIRGSHNKSLSLGLAAGGSVLVCDNLCFSGSAFKVLRKHTTHVWDDFKDLVRAHIGEAEGHYHDLQVDVAQMKAIPCPERRGYSFLGVMLGEGLLTPTQANVAFADWHQARYEDFAERNLWGLYNAVTEGLKKGAPAMMLDRHAKAHTFFQEIRSL